MFYEIVIEWIKTRGCEVQRDEKGEFDESKASSRCAGSIGSRENSKRGYQFLYRTKELLLCEWTEEEINKVSDF